MFGKTQGFKPQDFKPKREEPKAGPSYEPSGGSTVTIDLNHLFDLYRGFRQHREEQRRRHQEINLDILGLAKMCDGVISCRDLMGYMALSRQQANLRLKNFQKLGYCRVVDEVEGEELYLFEALLPEPSDCPYCGSRYRKDQAPHQCHNCGAQLARETHLPCR